MSICPFVLAELFDSLHYDRAPLRGTSYRSESSRYIVFICVMIDLHDNLIVVAVQSSASVKMLEGILRNFLFENISVCFFLQIGWEFVP